MQRRRKSLYDVDFLDNFEKYLWNYEDFWIKIRFEFGESWNIDLEQYSIYRYLLLSPQLGSDFSAIYVHEWTSLVREGTAGESDMRECSPATSEDLGFCLWTQSLRARCAARKNLGGGRWQIVGVGIARRPWVPPVPPPLQIHTYKQHKLHRRICESQDRLRLSYTISATSMTLFAQQHN